MSNLGFHAALRRFMETPGIRCERAFLETDPRRAGRSYDARTPLSEFDVVAFSVSFEEDFLTVASILEASGIELRSDRRSENDPIVVMGGVCALLNPEPIAPFLDVVLVGSADALIPSFVDTLAGRGDRGRQDVLRALSRLPGVYVPSLYLPEKGPDGDLVALVPDGDAPFPVSAVMLPDRMATSAMLSNGAFFSDMYLVEVSRGCARGCRFCAAGRIYGSVRHWGARDVLEAARCALPHTSRVGLVTAALGDHPELRQMLRSMVDLGIEIGLSSLRPETIDEEVARLLTEAGVLTVTMAPETGTEELRSIIGKPVTDDTIIDAARFLAEAGIPGVKLYFMVGLPGETDADIEAIPPLVRDVQRALRGGRADAAVSVSVSAFVPKPRTPFQWLPMADERSIRDKIKRLRRALASRPAVGFTSVGAREARRQGALARGGRELSAAIALSALHGVPWKAALRRAGVDVDALIGRRYAEQAIFPWDVVRVGPPREALLDACRAARRAIEAR
jgi:radical SAM superfamily enzyme YgiQ (UPF0313 family)